MKMLAAMMIISLSISLNAFAKGESEGNSDAMEIAAADPISADAAARVTNKDEAVSVKSEASIPLQKETEIP
ncbi:MAG: hypothetical protein V4736_12170, partial [Bdellovibrionota bacterium]